MCTIPLSYSSNDALPTNDIILSSTSDASASLNVISLEFHCILQIKWECELRERKQRMIDKQDTLDCERCGYDKHQQWVNDVARSAHAKDEAAYEQMKQEDIEWSNLEHHGEEDWKRLEPHYYPQNPMYKSMHMRGQRREDEMEGGRMWIPSRSAHDVQMAGSDRRLP